MDKTKVIELDQRSDGTDIQNYLLGFTNQRTVPNIFIAKEHIGGSSDLLGLEKQELNTLLAKI